MGRIVETTIERFDGGIINDSRNPAGNVARMISNFDVLTHPKKLTPYRSSVSGDSAPTTSIKRNFALALRTGTTYSLYALGVVSGQNYAEVLYKNLTASVNDLSDNAWIAPSANQSASGAPNFNLFVYYRKVNLIFGARAGTAIFAFSPSGSAWADSSQSLTYTEIGQGMVHSKDDVLYIPYYNNAGAAGAKSFIAKNNNGTWTNAALTLPDHLMPTSICEAGNFLAILCTPASGIGNSRIFLWDRNESTTTLAESIDAGTGSGIIIEELDGEVIIISQRGGTGSPSFTNNPAGTISHRDRIIFRKLVGNIAKKFLEIQADHAGGANTTSLPLYKQKIDNRLYFQMLIEFNGAVRDGVWSIGRSDLTGEFVLVHERTSNNNTALATGDVLRGFFQVGDYLFQSYLASSVHATTKTTSSSGTFAHNSVYESKRFDAGDSSLKKDLLGVTLKHEYLPSGATVTIQYRTDQTTSWTTIATNSTANAISTSIVSQQTSPAALPKDYKEIEFRILATGGSGSPDKPTEITGLSWQEEITGKRPY